LNDADGIKNDADNKKNGTDNKKNDADKQKNDADNKKNGTDGINNGAEIPSEDGAECREALNSIFLKLIIWYIDNAPRQEVWINAKEQSRRNIF